MIDKPLFLTSPADEATVCARCGYCNAVCCTHRELDWESTSPRGWLAMARELDWSSPFPGEFVARLFTCTLCGKCGQACPTHIDLRGLWLNLRQAIVEHGQGPAFTESLREAVSDTRNVFGLPNEERGEWVWFMPNPPADGGERDQADVLYYVGCVSSFSPAAQGIPRAMMRILEKAELDFAVLGGEEWCCGFPLVAAGLHGEARTLIEHNIETLQRLGARTVVFTCPSCYHIWRHEYNLPDVELLHATQFIARLLREGKLTLGRVDARVTYHDPCDLGRNSGVYDEPREILAALPGLDFVELLHNRAKAYCCGGGGDFEMLEPEMTEAIATRLIEESHRAAADQLVVACPQCKRIELRGVEALSSSVRVVDIVELVWEAIENGTSGRI